MNSLLVSELPLTWPWPLGLISPDQLLWLLPPSREEAVQHPERERDREICTINKNTYTRISYYYKDQIILVIFCIIVLLWQMLVTLFNSCVRFWTLYTLMLPLSMIATTCLPLGLTATAVMASSWEPMWKFSLQVWMLMNRITPSWLNTPSVYTKTKKRLNGYSARVNMVNTHI